LIPASDFPLYLKTLFKINVKRLAIHIPLASKHLTYTKFIILTTPRTGSTLLHTFLNYHLNVLSLGEPQNGDLPAKRWKAYPKLIKAVGFKAFYDSSSRLPVKEMLSQHSKNESVKIIWLRRRNKLRQWVSLKIAENTGEWSAVRTSLNGSPLKLSPSEFAEYVAKMGETDSQIQDHLTGKRYVTIFYEDLTENTELEMKKVWNFLAVAPIKPASLLKKQHPQPLNELITNYNDFIQMTDQ
tara:strand:+ start:37966 stop:38688 length:723 start_codon:yes stop_codon:yes gene_type:complete